jgi:hypothetical protein
MVEEDATTVDALEDDDGYESDELGDAGRQATLGDRSGEPRRTD